MQELNPNYADGPSEILEEVYPLPDGVEQADASEPVEEADYKLANDDSKCQADSAKNSTKVDYEDIGHDSQETPIEIEPGLETLKDDNQVEIVQPERHYTCEPNIIGYRKPSH